MPARSYISELLKREIRIRADGRCEYCLLHMADVVVHHEVDHIIASQHLGQTVMNNLAFACFVCNHYKGPNIASVDPQTRKIVPLFNPRTQRWGRHFRLNGPRIEPLTASGRATVSLLQLNHPRRLKERLTLIAAGRYPQT